MGNSLRILILAPIKRPILADTTVSRNRVIVDLVTGLIAGGHRITIMGTGDSSLPNAEIIPIVPTSLNFLPPSENPFYQHTAYLTTMISEALKRQGDFDIIHNHMYPEYLAFLALNSFDTPMVTTVHSQMTAETIMALKEFPKACLVAISEESKRVSGLSMTVVYNSVDTDFFVPIENPTRDYMLFVGRMSKARDENGNFLDPKGVGHAIKVAQRLGENLKIVGNVEDREFYETLVKPHLSDKITFVGEVSSEQKIKREEMRSLFQNAGVLINPINWQEPFGLVMAEALSCRTPVAAFKRGSVPEIVEDGKTGYVVEPEKGEEGLALAIRNIGNIDRKACREAAVAKFSKKRMVSDYEKVYLQLLR